MKDYHVTPTDLSTQRGCFDCIDLVKEVRAMEEDIDRMGRFLLGLKWMIEVKMAGVSKRFHDVRVNADYMRSLPGKIDEALGMSPSGDSRPGDASPDPSQGTPGPTATTATPRPPGSECRGRAGGDFDNIAGAD